MTSDPRPPSSRSGRSTSRHLGGFLASGILALTVDATVLLVGVRVFDLSPFVARLLAISVAMIAAWLAHRRLTFALTVRPSLNEFLRYAAAAWTTAGINYLVFAGVLLTYPSVTPMAALVIASIVATIFSYLSMRYGVFRRYRG
ncbi:MAG: GtrA family protein [Hyphomicrobiaceae bacterium]